MGETTKEPLVVRCWHTTSVGRKSFHRLQDSGDFRSLLEHGVIELSNSRNSPYALRASAFVGQALLEGDQRLVIRERFPGELQSLLDYCLPKRLRDVPVQSAASRDSTGAVLLSFAERFIDHVAEYLRDGRLKEYRREKIVSSTPRGKIDIGGTARLRAKGRFGKVVHSPPNLTADISHNRLLGLAFNTIEEYLQAESKATDIVDRARVFAPLFEDVSWRNIRERGWRHMRRSFDEVTGDRRTTGSLDAALSFARALVLHLGPWPQGDWFAGPPESQFVNVSLLFEDAVLAVADEILTTPVSPGEAVNVHLFSDSTEEYPVDPDFVVGDPNDPTLVGDCKYKPISDGKPQRSDLYQVLSHCEALGCAKGVLVYPGSKSGTRRVGTTHEGTKIWTVRVRSSSLAADLESTLKDIDRSLSVRLYTTAASA